MGFLEKLVKMDILKLSKISSCIFGHSYALKAHASFIEAWRISMPQHLAIYELNSGSNDLKSTQISLQNWTQPLCCVLTEHIVLIPPSPSPPWYSLSYIPSSPKITRINTYQVGIFQKSVLCLQCTILAPGHLTAAPCPGYEFNKHVC